MELRDKDNQEKLKKEVDKDLVGLQHQESKVVEENWNCLIETTHDTCLI